MGFKSKRVLLTGAGGFIGSHLAESILDQGIELTAFVRYTSKADWYQLKFLEYVGNNLTVLPGDLRDADAIRNACRDVDVIFHLGSLISIPYSYQHPRETVETNVIGTLNVLSAAREQGVERVIHTSTSEVYGTAQYVPVDEHHPLRAQSPYAASKIAADQLAESFSRSFDLPVVILRPFNTYGPRQSARAVIPTIITQLLTSDAISLGSLHPTRDFTYVADVVEAFLRAGEASGVIGETIQIGSNSEISIRDLVEKIAVLMGREVRILQDPERVRPERSEVERLRCDFTKATDLLGWHPTVSLEEGLERTIAWIADHQEWYKARYQR